MPNLWELFTQLLAYIISMLVMLTNSAGLAIILFGLIVFFLNLPLTFRSLQSTRRMQDSQAEVNEIQRQYGMDYRKVMQETQKFYKEHQIRPLSGCLPMMVQVPLFFGIHAAVIHLSYRTTNEQVRAAFNSPFLWLDSLALPDPLLILPIALGTFQMIGQLMTQPREQDRFNQTMTYIFMVIPVLFGFYSIRLASGTVLYLALSSALASLVNYVIFGWGVLSNYLRFLPQDHRMRSTILVSTPASGAQESSE